MEKVLFKIRGLEFGGIERLIVDIVNNLKLDNKKIVLLTEKNDNFFKKQLLEDIEIIYIKPDRVVKYLEYIDKKKKRNVFYKVLYDILNRYKKYKFAKNINNYIKDNNVNIFIDYIGESSKYISKIKVKNKIYWRHGSITKYELEHKKKIIKYLKNYDKLVVICDEMKEQYNSIFPELSPKLERIYNFIDEEKIDEKIKKEEELGKNLQKENYCISVGRLSDEKDYGTTIKAFKLLKKKNIKEKLYIIGDGDIKEKLKNMIKENNLEDQIFLLGAKENPYIYMKYADLFIHSSRTEGFGLVIAEAMHIGIPVICSNFKVGAYELVGKENNGEIFEIGDYETLALKIEGLLKDEDKKKEYIIKSKKIVKKFYVENIMKEYKKFIENI